MVTEAVITADAAPAEISGAIGVRSPRDSRSAMAIAVTAAVAATPSAAAPLQVRPANRTTSG